MVDIRISSSLISLNGKGTVTIQAYGLHSFSWIDSLKRSRNRTILSLHQPIETRGVEREAMDNCFRNWVHQARKRQNGGS